MSASETMMIVGFLILAGAIVFGLFMRRRAAHYEEFLRRHREWKQEVERKARRAGSDRT